MSDYSHSIEVNVPADRLFEFVSDIGNLPKYLPTTKAAQPQGEGRVRVQGEADGHRYDADGRFEAYAAQRKLQWSSDGEHQYAGRLEVAEMDAQRSRVTVQIHFELPPQEAPRFERQGGIDQVMNDGIRRALDSIRNLCEGTGGKNEAPQAG